MSFSSLVKQEVIEYNKNLRHCDIAEILSFINSAALVKKLGNRIYIGLSTENKLAAVRLNYLLLKAFDARSEVNIKGGQKGSKLNYTLVLKEPDKSLRILQATSVFQAESSNTHFDKSKINHLLIKDDCCKKAYLRGLFISCGSLSNPNKNYHLEFVLDSENYAREICKILGAFGLNGKYILRKSHYVVYIKEGENIVDFLNIIGAHKCLMNLENIRIIKDISNNVNRQVNCETANLTKTVTAAVKQVEDINYICSMRGREYLEEPLQEVAWLRLEYPNATLKEIGEMLMPPISKSGVNHRLRKISNIAEKLRRDRYD